MTKLSKKIGLFFAIAMGTLGQQALAAESYERLTLATNHIKSISTGVAVGHVRTVYGLTLTNNNSVIETVTVLKNSSTKFVVKVPANSTLSITLPTGLGFKQTDTLDIDLSVITSPVDMTLDTKDI